MYFRNYELRNTWLDKCLKSPVSEHCSTVNMLKTSKNNWNLRGSTFIIFSHQSLKMFLIVISEILGLFLNILTTDHKHCLCNRENLQQSIQMQLSRKLETLPQFFASSLKLPWNFEHLRKKMNLRAYVFLKLRAAKEKCRLEKCG